MSKQWENRIAREIWLNEPKYVHAYRAGYSGSGAMPQPDIHIFDNSTGEAHDAELKGPIAGDTIAIEDDDLEQLKACRSHMTRAWLVIKFQNRRPLTVPWVDMDFGKEDERPELETVAEEFEYIIDNMAPSFNPRTSTSEKTGITRLYLDKPPVDNEGEGGWPSARSSEDDYREILRGLGIYRPGNEE